MTKDKLSHGLIGVAAAIAIMASGEAAAQTSPRNYDIPAQDLASALRAFARASGGEVAFDPKLLRGKKSPAINGRLSPDEAMTRLLRASGLVGKRGASGIYIIKAAPIVAQPPLRPVPNRASFVQEPAPIAPPAVAPPPAEQSSGLDDIVVTAEKRPESLQRTPITISVLNAGALEERGVTGLQGLVNDTVPGLRVRPFAGRTSAFVIAIRGITPGDPTQVTRDPTVGVYVDGVYLGRVQGLGTEFLEVERIEVLKGPQGTLFGRNAVAGAISIVSKKPTGEFGGTINAGVRNLNGQNVGLHLNLPRFGNMSAKIDAIYAKRDGTVDNPLPGAWDYSAYKRWGVRATALWEPSDDFSLTYAFERSRDKSSSGYAHIDSLLPGAPALAPFFSLEPQRVRKARGYGFPVEPGVGDVAGHSLQMNWEAAPGLDIRSITAYRSLEQGQYDNFSGSFYAYAPGANFGRLSNAFVKQHQFSEELQFIGDFGPLKFVGGAYYYREKARDLAETGRCCRFTADGQSYMVLPEPVFSVRPDRASRVRAVSRALFAQATYTPALLDERLHLTVGGRLTDDKKSGGLTALRGAPSNLAFTFNRTRFDPTATIAFDLAPSVNTYLRWGTAYRAGGANTRTLTLTPFDEEEVESFELGAKSEFFDRRLRANVALFTSTRRGLQIDVFSPVNPAASETVNAIRPVKAWGGEVEVTAAPAEGVTLGLAYSFTKVDLPAQPSPFTSQIIQLQNTTPKHSFSADADWNVGQVGPGELVLHFDASGASSAYSGATDPQINKGYVIANARATLRNILIGSNKLAVAAWVKNLANKQYVYFDEYLAGPGLTNALTTYYNEPRTYGVELKVDF